MPFFVIDEQPEKQVFEGASLRDPSRRKNNDVLCQFEAP